MYLQRLSVSDDASIWLSDALSAGLTVCQGDKSQHGAGAAFGVRADHRAGLNGRVASTVALAIPGPYAPRKNAEIGRHGFRYANSARTQGDPGMTGRHKPRAGRVTAYRQRR